MDFVHAAQVSGASSLRIVVRHILPNCFSPLLCI
jgi:peptide/nickel transport system permease protein